MRLKFVAKPFTSEAMTCTPILPMSARCSYLRESLALETAFRYGENFCLDRQVHSFGAEGLTLA
jgi:hypothetical protein